jgi:hypothetical protein
VALAGTARSESPPRGYPVSPRGAPPRGAAAAAGGLVLAFIVAGPLLDGLAHRWSASTIGPVADVTALWAAGVVIAWHRPANPLGWILLGAHEPK